MTALLIYNEPQLHFALTQFFHSRDELDNRACNDDPLERLDHATYLADRSELRVLLRNRCLRSTIAASTAGKTVLVRNLWEAVHRLNIQKFEEEVLYLRRNSRRGGPDVDHWLDYHAGVDATGPQPVLLAAGFDTPEIVRAASLPNPFNGTTPGRLAHRHTPALPAAPAAPAAPPPPLTPSGVPGADLIFPPSATRNAQDQPEHDHRASSALILPAEAARGPPEYAILPPDRSLTPRWFIRVRDRLMYGRQEHHGHVHFQAILERLRRQAGQSQPEPAEQRQQQTQQRPNRPPVVDLLHAERRRLRKFLDWCNFLFCWTLSTPVLLVIGFM